MAKKGGSEADFMALTRSQREADKPGHVGMVMTKPPIGPSMSLEEMLADNQVEVLVAPPVVTEQIAVQSVVLKGEEPKVLDSKTLPLELPVEQIHPSKYQVRSVADPEYIDSLCESIQISGVISPIIVRPFADGYEIIAGHHRFEACRRLGHSLVAVKIREMADDEAAKALASDNFVRRDLSDYERYKHSKMLRDNGFCKTGREIASVLGVSSAKISQLNSFDKLPTGAKAVLEINPNILGSDAAYKLENIARDEPDLFTEALLLVVEGKLLQTKIRDWVKSKTAPVKVRLSHQYRSELKIERSYLSKPIRLTFTEHEAKIQSEGIDPDKLKKLIEDNLDSLLR
jgi:ParB family chromosome partitioning protein